MIKEVKMFTAICDKCGKDAFEGDEYSCWDEEDVAILFATDLDHGGTYKTIDRKHYCDDCYEFNEETDEYEVKK